jgi:ribose transport system permease protein
LPLKFSETGRRHVGREAAVSKRVLSASAGAEDTSLAFIVPAGVVAVGTSILGGGAVWQRVVGVLSIAVIGNGHILLGLDPLYEQITIGVILLVAVGLDAWSRRSA